MITPSTPVPTTTPISPPARGAEQGPALTGPRPDPSGRLSLAASGILAEFGAAGVIGLAETQIARHLTHMYGEADDLVTLAAALVLAALRAGSVGLDLARADAVWSAVSRAEPPALDPAIEGGPEPSGPPPPTELPWPDVADWTERLTRSALVTTNDQGSGQRPLRLVDGLLYLERSWDDQERVADAVHHLLSAPWQSLDGEGSVRSFERYFDRSGLAPGEPDRQLEAALLALRHRLVVIGGGPGTGKTTTVAKVLAVLADRSGPAPRICLAAPTGKAAARLDGAVRRNLRALGQGAVAETIPPAATIHRLLGIKPWGAVDRGPQRPLAADVIVVDEVSMLSLRHMRLLLDAVPTGAQVILVGDPDQLASVESGAVLADLVAALTSPAASRGGVPPTALPPIRPPSPQAQPARDVPFVRLDHNFRFAGAIGDLAEAVRLGCTDRVLDLLGSAPAGIEFAEADLAAETDVAPALAAFRDTVLDVGHATMAAVAAGDWPGALAAVDRHRVLCAHRQGPCGVARWGHLIEGWLTAALPGYGQGGPWYLGLPVQVTHNDEVLGVFNGDTGVIVSDQGRRRVALATTAGPRLIGPAELSGLEPIHATTIHKAQGSQYGAVTVIVPPASAALLTRELLYTAITRAEHAVRLIGTPESVAHAVEHPALRASGLAGRLTRRPAGAPKAGPESSEDRASRISAPLAPSSS
jgi:exodeoxyribonuclease V alpha subunit